MTTYKELLNKAKAKGMDERQLQILLKWFTDKIGMDEQEAIDYVEHEFFYTNFIDVIMSLGGKQ